MVSFMVEWHTKSKRKKSGGKRNSVNRSTKKKAWKGGRVANTKAENAAKEERTVNRARGNNKLVKLISSKFANHYDESTKKTIKAEIIDVKENHANRLYARSNIATKGAILRIKVGSKELDAKVTNRPGQDGVINTIIA